MSHATERLTAALADRYRLLRPLGSGGMATVYLAEDIKHDRKVAVKVLKPELAAVLGAERFVVEIKTTAAMSHPHILPLFDSGEADGFLFYVMPYIEGETLRDKLNRETQFSIEEALQITREVADALDYAHRHGVIHRDIKPENLLLHDGRAMVMDFGIALAVSAAAGGRMTETGLSLGTPHYMSPEQATADKQITGRSDQYSLASVLYEMLAGEPPHTGASAQQIVMKIIAERAQPVTELRRSVPEHVAAAIDKALSKLPADRFGSLREFSQALGDPRFTSATVAKTRAMSAPSSGRGMTWVAAALGVALVAVSAFALRERMQRPELAPESRVAIALPVALATESGGGSTLAASADGTMLAFVGMDSAGARRVWVKRTDEATATPVLGTENARSPFLSPDGRELAYFTPSGDRLMAVALAGGQPREVTAGDLGGNGGVWGSDGYLYFDAGPIGIDRIRPDGTGRSTVVALDTTRRELGYAWPELLPGDQVLVARLRHIGESAHRFSIVAIPLNGDSVVTLTRGLIARYLNGMLAVLRADGVLEGFRLRNGGLALDTSAVTLATTVGVELSPFGMANVATDRFGALHYISAQDRAAYRLSWVGPDGVRVPADSGVAELEARNTVILPAPGGRRVLVARLIAPDTIPFWTRELPSGTMLPVLEGGSRLRGAGWGLRDDSLMIAVAVQGGSEIRLLRADGLGAPVVLARDSLILAGSVTATAGFETIVCQRVNGNASIDLVAIDRRSGKVTRTLATAPANSDFNAVISPDGKFIAYQAMRDNRPEIVVRPFPEVDAGIWQVSFGGGITPVWSDDGKRLAFRRFNTETVMVVDVQTRPTFTPGRPQPLLEATEATGLFAAAGFGLSPDGQRILVTSRVDSPRLPQLVRVQLPR